MEHPRRPAFLTTHALDQIAGSPDPADIAQAAHASAERIVDAGRASSDPQVRARLLSMVEDHGLEAIAGLWADRPARTLPGALWRLYVVREGVRRDSVQISRDYEVGAAAAPVLDAVAGVATPPGPDQVVDLADAVLHGVFSGDLAVALERAGAFARVVATGRALRADDVEPADEDAARALTQSADALRATASDLEAAAKLWRANRLT